MCDIVLQGFAELKCGFCLGCVPDYCGMGKGVESCSGKGGVGEERGTDEGRGREGIISARGGGDV